MSTQTPRMHFNPPPNWPSAPAGWYPPPGWKPEPSWGPPPEGWPLWVEDRRQGWFGRHKLLTGVGGGFLALILLLCTIGAVSGGSASPSDIESAPSAGTAADDKEILDEADAGDEEAPRDEGVPGEGDTLDEVAGEEARVFMNIDCQQLAEEAVRISADSTEALVKLLKVRAPQIRQDNRGTYEIPTGTDAALVLSCTGVGVWSDSSENVDVMLKLEVDADGDAFVYYEALF